MNNKEKLRETVIKNCIAGEMTSSSAAARLGVSVRQIKRMKARYREGGVQSMLHGNCGRQPAKTLSTEIKQKILEIRKQPEFETVNTKHFQEILETTYKTKVSYAFLSNLLPKFGDIFFQLQAQGRFGGGMKIKLVTTNDVS